MAKSKRKGSRFLAAFLATLMVTSGLKTTAFASNVAPEPIISAFESEVPAEPIDAATSADEPLLPTTEESTDPTLGGGGEVITPKPVPEDELNEIPPKPEEGPTEDTETHAGITFLPLSEDVASQNVPEGTSPEALVLPEQLEAHDSEQASISVSVTWVSEPEYDGKTAGEYTFVPVLPEDCLVADGTSIPSIQVVVEKYVPSDPTNPVVSFLSLDESVSKQEVENGTHREALTLPEQLQAVDAEGKSLTFPVTWISNPEFYGTVPGTYFFTPVLPDDCSIAEGVEVPSIEVIVLEKAAFLTDQTILEVSTPEDFEKAIYHIKNGDKTEYTILLTADIDLTSGFAGVPGKSVTVTSQTSKNVFLPLATDLVGNIILDRVRFSESYVFANGNHFETTENASGTIQHLYGGGSKGNDIDGDTSIILRGGKISAYLFGGGLDSNVSGNVHIVLDGENVVVSQLFGGGHAKETPNGCVDGDVTIDFREGSTSEQFGGGMNEFSFEADMRTPATVTGTVTVNFGYEGAKAHSVCPGLAMYPKCGSYHSTVGDIRVNITDGVYMAERNVMTCGYNDTVLGTVQMRIFGNPDMGSAHIVGGGEGDGTPSPLDNSGPIRILNQKNEENAIYISYNVPNENNAGHGILAGSRYNDTEISGNVLVELIDGNLDFIQTYDYVTETYQSITGHPEVLVKGGRCAQIFGDQHPKEGHKAIATVTGGNVDIGVFFSLGEVNIQNNAVVDVDSEKFEQYDGNIQKPFYSVDNLNIAGNSKLTTRNSSTQILNNVTMENGTWHAKGYTYIYEGMYTKDSQIFFDTYYQIAYNHRTTPTEDTLLTSQNDTVVAMANDFLDAIHCSIDVKNSTWSVLNPLKINGHAKFENVLLRLPAVGNQETNNYPNKQWIPIKINGVASGSAQVETVEPAAVGTDSTSWVSKPSKPSLGDNYLICWAPDGTDSSNEEKRPIQSTFLLKNPDATADGLYLKREKDSVKETENSYFMWQVAKYNIVTFNKNGGDTEADPKQKIVPGGSTVGTLPTAPTRKNHTFLGWNTETDGSGTEFTATTPVTSDITVYAQWEKMNDQLWYKELYYQFYTPDGSETDENGATYNWIRQSHGQDGWAFPDDKVNISHTNFDGTQFDWNAIDGSGKETLGVHYVYNENYGPHRLSALCKEATKDNPLKIYYRTTPHTVTYQYKGDVPNGAPEVPAAVHTGYSAPVTVAAAPTLEGYQFSGWTVQSPSGVTIKNGQLTMPNKDVVLVGTWGKETTPIEPMGAVYKVEHYKQQNDGTYQLEETDFPLFGKIGEVVTAMPKSYPEFSVNTEISILSGTVTKPETVDGKMQCLLLKVYYQQNPKGDLTVTKYVTGNRGDYQRSFPIQVALQGERGLAVNGIYGGMTFVNGVANFTLKDNESKTAYDLPAGLEYIVTETNSYGHSATYTGQTGTIPVDGAAAASITNHRSKEESDSGTDDDDDKINVTVKKIWKLDDGRKAADSIRVELLRNGKHYDWVTLSKDNNWRYTWRSLNDNYSWTVQEEEIPEGFQSTISHRGNTWTITNDDKPQHELPKTGQNWLLPIFLGTTGIMATVYGIYRKKERSNLDGKK